MIDIMITATDMRSDMIVDLNNELYHVIESQHIKPGKGPAFVRAKLKNFRTKSIIDKTFRPEEKIEKITLEEREVEYLYSDRDNFVFMDLKTYEQYNVSEKEIGDCKEFLKENLKLWLIFYKGKLLSVKLPMFVEMRVKLTEPGIRGDTVSGGSKPATLESGAVIQVPLFIETGDLLKIDTRTKTYVERIKTSSKK